MPLLRRPESAPEAIPKEKPSAPKAEVSDIWGTSRPSSACWVSASAGTRSSERMRRPISTPAPACDAAAPKWRRPEEAETEGLSSDLQHEERDLCSRLTHCTQHLPNSTRTACLQRLEQHLEARTAAANSAATCDGDAPQKVEIPRGSEKGASNRQDAGHRTVPRGHGGNPGRRTAAVPGLRRHSATKESPPAAAADDTVVSDAAEDVAATTNETETALPGSSTLDASADVQEKPARRGKQRRQVRFKDHFKVDVLEWEEASRRQVTALEAMRRVTTQRRGNAISKCWKRLPESCHFMREELCRSILANFLEHLHGILELSKDKTPLSRFEEKHIDAIIKAKDVVGLVKYLEETEMHIRYGPQRGKILPDAPLNMRIFTSLRQERTELAVNWRVSEQGLREERVFGLFLRGPFTWSSLRQLLWEAPRMPPPVDDNPGVTDEEERQHDERIHRLACYQDQLRQNEEDDLHAMEEATYEDLNGASSQVAPDGLIDAVSRQGSRKGSVALEGLFHKGPV